jgi:hypothetical protein
VPPAMLGHSNRWLQSRACVVPGRSKWQASQ